MTLELNLLALSDALLVVQQSINQALKHGYAGNKETLVENLAKVFGVISYMDHCGELDIAAINAANTEHVKENIAELTGDMTKSQQCPSAVRGTFKLVK